MFLWLCSALIARWMRFCSLLPGGNDCFGSNPDVFISSHENA
jgi:hypothetical protein